MDFPRTPADIEPSWLEGALRAAGRWPRVRVDAVAAERIGREYGLDGVIARVRITGEGPASVVFKWTKAASVVAEARFLQRVAPRVALDLPACHGSFVDEGGDAGLLLLEDIHPARQPDVLRGFPFRDATALLDAEAVLHGTFWNATDGPDLEDIPHWTGGPPDFEQGIASQLPVLHDRFGDLVPAPVQRLLDGLPDRIPEARALLLAAPRTVIHRDLHIENVLFRPSGVPVILDWSGVQRGPAAVDFSRLLLEGVPVDLPRDQRRELATGYLDALARAGVRDYGPGDLQREVAAALRLGVAYAIRWASREDRTKDIPRVDLLVRALLRCSAALLTDIDQEGEANWM